MEKSKHPFREQCVIAMVNDDYTVTAIRCRWQGALAWGILREYYTEKQQVQELINNGDLVFLGKEVGEEAPDSSEYDDMSATDIHNVCHYFHRDSHFPWESCKPKNYEDLCEPYDYAHKEDINYMYFYNRGNWERKDVEPLTAKERQAKEKAEAEMRKKAWENSPMGKLFNIEKTEE